MAPPPPPPPPPPTAPPPPPMPSMIAMVANEGLKPPGHSGSGPPVTDSRNELMDAIRKGTTLKVDLHCCLSILYLN